MDETQFKPLKIFSSRFFLRHLGPPLFVFILARLFLLIVAASSQVDLSGTDLWERFDSGHYLSIAIRGYSYYPCSAEENFGPEAWCGTSGWFPGYPMLIKILSFLFPSPEWTAVFLSALFHLGTLTLLWSGFFQSFWNRKSVLCLSLAAFFPGQIYYHAIFPLSISTFLALLFLLLIRKNKVIGAGLAAAVACYVYPTGFLLLGIGFLYLLFKKRPGAAIFLVGLSSLGLLGVAVTFHLSVGHWDAYLKTHHKYNQRLSNPLMTFSRAIKPLLRLKDWWPSDKISLVNFQTNNGHFFSVEDRNLIANRNVPGDWETFERIALGGGKVALRAHTNLFLCTSETDRQTILARCPMLDPSAIFQEVKGVSPFIGLKTREGNFLCPDEGDKKRRIQATCPNLDHESLLKAESRAGSRGRQRAVIAGQTGLVAGLMLLLLFYTFNQRSQLRSTDFLFILYTIAYWFFPLSLGSNFSLYRAESLLLPSIFLGRNLPSKFLILILILEIILAFLMGQLFFRHVLI